MPHPGGPVKIRQRGLFSEVAVQHEFRSEELQADVSFPVDDAREPMLPPAKTFVRPKNLLPAAYDVDQATFDNPALEPRVVAPYVTRPGQAPRKIEIERKKRLFAAQDLTGLLRAEGVDYSKPAQSSLASICKVVAVLPLEVFDDEDMEERSVAEWMRIGGGKGVPCQGLHVDKDGVGTWRPARALAWNHKEQRFEVEWDEIGYRSSLLARMHVCFRAEDPFNFVRRVTAAHRRRKAAEMFLLYSLYVDAMPIDIMPELDSQQAKRIMAMVLNPKALAQAPPPDAKALLVELKVQAARAMNKITFDTWAVKNPNHALLQDLVLPDMSVPRKPPPDKGVIALPVQASPIVTTIQRGTYEIPATGYGERAHAFSFSSFLTKPELIKVIVALRSECLKVLQLTFFAIIAKSVRLDEFANMQNVALAAATQAVKEGWPTAVQNHIRANLKDMKKGWFNLEETNNEVYKFSKFKKFLSFVNFAMQDTLRFLVEDSLTAYTNFMTKACELRATISGPNNVELEAPAASNGRPASGTGATRLPLFIVDLQVEGSGVESRIGFSTSPDAFFDLPLAMFDKALAQIQNIIRVERKVMKRLFWSFDPVMNTVHPSEQWVMKLRAQIEEGLRRSVQAVHQYSKVYEKYLSFLRMDTLAYMRDIEEKYGSLENLQIDQMKKLAVEHLREIAEIEATIPDSINLGAFTVSCLKVSRALISKHQRLNEQLMELIARKTIENANTVVDRFKVIQHRLNKLPANIEDLTELKEFLGTIPAQLGELRGAVSQVLTNFASIESVQFKLDKGALGLQWEVFGWPRNILSKVVDVEQELVRRKREFQLNMEEEQEGFVEKLKSLRLEVESLHQFTDISRVDNVASHVRRIKKDLAESEEEARRFNSREMLFNKDVTEYTALQEVQKAFEPYCDLWENTDNWLKWQKKWVGDPFMTLDAEKIERDVGNMFKNLSKAQRFFEKAGLDGCLQIAKNIRAQVDEFRPNIPLIMGLRNPGMKDRHWKGLSRRVEKDIQPSDTLTLAKLLSQGLAKYADVVTKISEAAAKEYTIETSLDKMERAWKDVVLHIESYRESGTYILKGVDEITTLLDEHITMTQAMSFSTFKGPFEERIDNWNRTLQVVSEVVDEWVAVQRNWLYLQPIFDSPDINKQLPTEGKRFSSVDKHWRSTMQAASGGKALAIRFCCDTRLLERFRESNKLLEMVQKGLADYLETKRACFPRFYFLSNDELLEILSQTKDPLAVQPHLRKCFEGIKTVDFDMNDLTIHAMNSSEGEKVAFASPINPNGKSIETWMVELNKMMCRSVRHQMILAVKDYVSCPRTEWMQNWPGQVVINGSQVHWTLETEALIREKGNQGVHDYHKQLIAQLHDMVFLIRGKLSPMARITIGALAVIDVHARDVMKKMAEAGVSKVTDFDWISQLRYYWEGDHDTGDLKVVMVSAKRAYGYEYLGNSFRLVITPLTDKCYLTIMGALQMVLGGAPAGPAGTGKTETTKDLAKALAKQCVVFNCSDGLDYLAMGKFFKGLASSGAWACFDEFNRINIEVLSVIAQQIMTLQGAVMRKETRVIFEDTDIYVDPDYASFITMNPGYAGRSDLPDNLEALFRPVAMMVPDYVLIGEIMLFSYGYLENRQCAMKMVQCFRLCSEQLSSQDHYDYGMRAVKTVITAAGNLKRDNPDENEEALLLRALQDVNRPKFLGHDLPLFEGILSDLFPGIERPPFDYGPFLASVKLQCERMNLQPVPVFLTKVIELYEMVCVRHGLMVVGPTGGGKSSNIAVLRETLGHLNKEGIKGVRYEKVRTFHLNPKSITMGQLYGQFDENTHEWQDGILAGLVRDCIKTQTPDLKWLVFDGPVDAIWIENMNTVLDDNKKLCLTSGEIMALTEEMTMMFEPEDLAVASPATVSRCGMIYMEPTSLGWDPLLQSWLNTLPKSLGVKHKARLMTLFDTYVTSGLTTLRRFLTEPLPTVDNSLVQGLINILDGYMDDFRPHESREVKKKDEIDALVEFIEPLFIFSLIWSVACTVNTQGRKIFDTFLRTELMSNNSSWQLPPDGKVYDYVFDYTSKTWMPWMNTVQPYVYDPKLSFAELIVPTMDSVRYTYLLSHLVRHDQHVLMTGPTGTGKTVNINEQLQKGFDEKYVPICLTFSAQTSANQTQDLIDSKCEKRRKGVFGPAAGKKFIIFVDDVNMPQREFYGAQPPIEILRQWFDSGGWYDRKALTFRQIIDVVFVCACGPPGGGRNAVTPRFFRHFNIIGYTPIQDESMMLIFHTILGNFVTNFDDSISSMAESFVRATIEIYNTIVEDLRPTPAKPHYTFNMRDLSKVFQGMLMVPVRKDANLVDFARVWVHENRRVFGDRLVSQEDREWFDGLLFSKMATHIGVDMERMGDKRVIYGDFMIPGADPKIYEEIKNLSDLQPTIEEYLQEYNAESKQPMNLVLFMDAVEHVSRISRVIRQPQGNAVLLGVGGSGRQSLTKLATFMAGYKLYQIEISKGYGKNEWRENLKQCLLMAGVDDKPVTFLFTDTQIVMEQMLEDVNSVLNSGDVPNLYGVDEMETITNACRADCVRKRVPPTKLNIFAAYLIRVRRNIHIVLCMSPLGEAFRTRLRMFPSIVNCCTIDWFQEWPDEALVSVATRSMQQANLNLGVHADHVIDLVKHIHQSVASASKEFAEQLRRFYYVTPTSYLELLSTYKSVLLTKREEVGTLKNRLQVGLDKLISTAQQVETLQESLTQMEPVLIATQLEVEQMIVQIGKDKTDAAETQRVVAAEEAAALKKAADTKAIADDAQRDLDEALPALDAAVACLKDLKKADIDEVKSMGRPPAGVRLVMQATCVMFDIPPEKVNDPDNPGKKVLDYFKAAQKNLLSNAASLLENMQSYDKDNIPDRTIKAIDPFMTMPEFEPTAVEKASKASKAICMWVRAMHKYHDVAVMVEPKKQLLAVAQADLEQTLATLAVAQGKLQEVMDRIAKLEADFKTANDKKDQLIKDVVECRGRLDRAQKLIGGLGGERTRWTTACQGYEDLYNNLVGDALVSAGMIAYSGAFTPEFRQKLLHNWQAELSRVDVPHTEDCDLRVTLADPVAIRTWAICGLPQDNHSIENGIIMSKARRYPLMVDPQGQANRFVKNMGKDATLCPNGLDVVKLSDKNFLRVLENAVRFGRWALLENVGETLDAALEPLLLQQRFRQSGTEMIRIGDSTIPWNDTFRFFITTKLPNPHYPPETCVKVSLLNFAITFSGLEDQLLGVVVVEEMPEMEAKKNTLVTANARMKKELKEIEDKILFMLSNSKGNILDDVELIETLASSKKTSQEITAKVAEAEKTEEEIDGSRERYRPVAYRGSILYFLIADLAQVDPMYAFSLSYFTSLFTQAIRAAERSKELETRLENLNSYFAYYTYVNVCRSLFEKDKLLFSFIMTIKLMEGNNELDPGEWRFLISGKSSTPLEGTKNPAPEWIDGRMWNEIENMACLPNFQGFEIDVKVLLAQWKAYYDATDPHKMQLPGKWRLALNSLQRMCVLRCFRADKIPEAILDFVIEKMGQKFVEPPPFNLTSCYADSNVVTPLIFVLSKGSDPTKAFYEFAASMKFDKKVKGLSLGQGQGIKASRLIEEATQKGTWVYLQNCHLYISWLTELERICENLSPETVHKDFRLWLTSMPCKDFPVSILQNGVKMTNEPPKGLKANLRNAYFKLDNAKLSITSKPTEYKKLLFGLCFFHAIVQERRKFGPLGWNIPYEFNDTDLDISRGQLAIFLDNSQDVPYRVLNFLTSYINYGGRVTDYIDLRTIDVIMKSFYNEQILQDGYQFDADGIYYSISFDEENPHTSYMDYIDALPLVAGPSVFGLHDNANIAYALNETFTIFDTILSLQARESAKGGVTREEQIGTVARDIERRLNEKGAFDVEQIRMQYPVRYEESMNTVLLQECIRYNKLIMEMQRSLPELQKALKGLLVMSGELEAMGDSIAVNQVPKAWEAKAYPSMKPLAAWANDLIERLTFINQWVEKGTPVVIWVSGFYFPQAFLTGSMQNFARKHRLPIVTVEFDFNMVDAPWESIRTRPEDGVYIRGLFLEGARWDVVTRSLADSRPKQLYTPMPVIHLQPCQNRKEPTSGIYRCPVYKVLSRKGVLSTTGHSTNFIMWIEVPAKEPSTLNNVGKADTEKWIKAGVAAFCSLRY